MRAWRPTVQLHASGSTVVSTYVKFRNHRDLSVAFLRWILGLLYRHLAALARKALLVGILAV
jgi:hypothetical protein